MLHFREREVFILFSALSSLLLVESTIKQTEFSHLRSVALSPCTTRDYYDLEKLPKNFPYKTGNIIDTVEFIDMTQTSNGAIVILTGMPNKFLVSQVQGFRRAAVRAGYPPDIVEVVVYLHSNDLYEMERVKELGIWLGCQVHIRMTDTEWNLNASRFSIAMVIRPGGRIVAIIPKASPCASARFIDLLGTF